MAALPLRAKVILNSVQGLSGRKAAGPAYGTSRAVCWRLAAEGCTGSGRVSSASVKQRFGDSPGHGRSVTRAK